MPPITDLDVAELAAIGTGDDILLQRLAAEIRRRRFRHEQAQLEIAALERFISRPVNRISHPMVVEAIERMIAHLQGAASGE